MKYLVIGGGSAGQRHYKNLRSLGREVYLQSAHLNLYPTITPDAVVIANETSKHIETALQYPGIPKLIEKPLSNTMNGVDELTGAVLVGYQYRFDILLNVLKNRMSELGQIERVYAHMGQHLADWHPGEDYHKSYAAQDGALLTLSHPIDYLRWLFGECDVMDVIKTTLQLAIPADDTGNIMLAFGDMVARVDVNMWERPGRHYIEITGENGTAYWSPGHLQIGEWDHSMDYDRNIAFLAEMRHFTDIVEQGVEPSCTLDDGIKAMEIALG